MTRIQINVYHAEELKDVERMGKNDAYLVAALDLKNKDGFAKTAVKKNSGKTPEWNETLFLENYDPNRHNEVYITILDSETLADEPIGFTSIGLNQISNAPGKALKGKYEVYLTNGKQEGYVTVELIILESGEQARSLSQEQPVRGVAQLDGEQQKFVKSLERKESAGDAAVVAGVLGAAFGAKALFGGSKKADTD
ncbi:hypothetical protein BGZ76_003502 [Entomortierella beljakovae]|nr:hypothetical protein BGZ76_003502 [Entomortierella beljakovae]